MKKKQIEIKEFCPWIYQIWAMINKWNDSIE